MSMSRNLPGRLKKLEAAAEALERPDFARLSDEDTLEAIVRKMGYTGPMEGEEDHAFVEDLERECGINPAWNAL